MLPLLLQESLVKVPPKSKEDSFGTCLLVVGIFECCELDAADEVGNLLEPVVVRITIAICYDLAPKGILESRVQNARYVALPVVVIDLDSLV